MDRRMRVLIVDDDPEILTQLRWALQDEFDLLVAGSPAEAESILRGQEPPEAALVDLHLPPDTSSIDGGISLIQSLRSASEETRIIAFSAHQSDEAQRLSRSAGARVLLNKPVRRGTLLHLLRTTMD